jgi:hypothetical protein
MIVSMWKYIFPRIALADLLPMIGIALIGALLAGMYGMLHDLVTYSISPEYFTKLKFDQFHYADFGFGNRVFAATVGFLASWWVGFVIAWFLGRRLVPNQPRADAYRQIRAAFGLVIMIGTASSLLGFVYGFWRGPDADYSSWQFAIEELEIIDKWSFVRVAYIHNASYLGGVIGLIAALITLRPVRE